MHTLYITSTADLFLRGVGNKLSDKLIHSYLYYGDIANSTQEIYLYGSQLQSNNRNNFIKIKNPLIPAGTVIYRWNMIFAFGAAHAIPWLPILDRGQKYDIQLHAKFNTKDSIFIRILTFDYTNKLLNIQIIKETEGTFTYPEDAFFYIIELVNANVDEMEFERLDIYPATDSEINIEQEHQKNIARKQKVLANINKYL